MLEQKFNNNNKIYHNTVIKYYIYIYNTYTNMFIIIKIANIKYLIVS